MRRSFGTFQADPELDAQLAYGERLPPEIAEGFSRRMKEISAEIANDECVQQSMHQQYPSVADGRDYQQEFVDRCRKEKAPQYAPVMSPGGSGLIGGMDNKTLLYIAVAVIVGMMLARK